MSGTPIRRPRCVMPGLRDGPSAKFITLAARSCLINGLAMNFPGARFSYSGNFLQESSNMRPVTDNMGMRIRALIFSLLAVLLLPSQAAFSAPTLTEAEKIEALIRHVDARQPAVF